MDATHTLDPNMVGTGLLIGRLVLGLIMAAHGAQKLFGWFGGYGLNATGEFFVQLGFAPGRLFAFAASAGELASGLLVALGFLGPVGPALMLSASTGSTDSSPPPTASSSPSSTLRAPSASPSQDTALTPSTPSSASRRCGHRS